MRVESIEFNGITFRRYPDSSRRDARVYYTPNGAYRKRGVGRLHQEIWKAAYGPIPEGHHIHHRDEDTLNNELDNLVALPGFDHLSNHAKAQPIEEARARMDHARAFASDWHSSEEGRAWHRKHGERTWAEREPRSGVCEHCGTTYSTLSRHGNERFCSNKCRAAWRRASGVDDETRTCEVCGSEYVVNKYSKKRACSPKCGAGLRHLPGGDRHRTQPDGS